VWLRSPDFRPRSQIGYGACTESAREHENGPRGASSESGEPPALGTKPHRSPADALLSPCELEKTA
jgi:hypothetical protein